MLTGQDFLMYENTAKDVLYTLTDVNTNGPLNIDGMTFDWLAVFSPHDEARVTKSLESGITVVQYDDVATIIKVSIVNSDIPFNSAGCYLTYLRNVSGGQPELLAIGNMTVLAAPFTD